jgi:MgtC family protein
LLEEIDPLQDLTAHFLVGMGLSFLAGFLIGLERDSKGKPAGISTHCFVIGGSMIFSYLSSHVDPNSTSRIAGQIITGMGLSEDMFESFLKYQAMLGKEFSRMQKKDGLVPIDGNRNPEEIHRDLRARIDKFLLQ